MTANLNLMHRQFLEYPCQQFQKDNDATAELRKWSTI